MNYQQNQMFLKLKENLTVLQYVFNLDKNHNGFQNYDNNTN